MPGGRGGSPKTSRSLVDMVRGVGVKEGAVALEGYFAQQPRRLELVQGVVDGRQGHVDACRHRFMVEAFGTHVAVACSKQDGSQG